MHCAASASVKNLCKFPLSITKIQVIILLQRDLLCCVSLRDCDKYLSEQANFETISTLTTPLSNLVNLCAPLRRHTHTKHTKLNLIFSFILCAFHNFKCFIFQFFLFSIFTFCSSVIFFYFYFCLTLLGPRRFRHLHRYI